jgi:DNA-binding transcriptional ArsR family regulator
MKPSLDLVLAALANPTRRAILDRLMAGEASVGDLAAPFALSQPTISSHLKILESAGLVSRGRRATLRPVRLEPAALAALDDWIGPYRRLWEDRYDRLEAVAQDLQARETDDDDHDAG